MDSAFTTIIDLAKTAGPFATVLMVFLYIRVDNERKLLDKEIRDILRSSQGVTDSLLRILDRGGKGKGDNE